MTELDPNVVEEVCKMLTASQEFDENVQREIFNDMASFQSQSDITLYLLSAVANGNLSDQSRCVAAILMRRFFAQTQNTTKEIFKQNIYPILAPFFDLPPSPLVNCVSSLFADLLAHFGIETFPDIPQIMANLLQSNENSQSGLSLIYELLLREIPMDAAILELLVPHLQTEHAAFVLKIMASIAQQHPDIVCENILPIIFEINLSELSEEQILETISICNIILKSRIEEEIIAFLVNCISLDNDNISFSAAEIFEQNEEIPFVEEVITALFNHLAYCKNIYICNSSTQCMLSLTAITHRYPDESLHSLSKLMENEKNIKTNIRAIPSIIDITSEPEKLLTYLFAALTTNTMDVIDIISEISSIFGENTFAIIQQVIQFISSPDINIRISVLRCLEKLLLNVPVPCDPLSQIFYSCFDNLTVWEIILLLRTLTSFFANVGDSENNQNFFNLVYRVCYTFSHVESSDPFLCASIPCLSMLPKSSPHLIQFLMSTVGERLFDSLFIDDSQLCSLALGFYTSIIESEKAPSLQDLFSTVLQKIDKFLGSSNCMQRVAGWNYMNAVIIHNQALLQGADNVVLAAICEETTNKFEGEVMDIVCEIIYSLIGILEFGEIHIAAIYEIFKLCYSNNYISYSTVCCFLKFTASFSKLIKSEENVTTFFQNSFDIIIDTPRQEECEEFLESLNAAE